MTEGPFQVTFELSAASYAAGEPIDGRAQLVWAGDGETVFSSSGGGPFAFEFREVDGPLHVQPIRPSDCAVQRLAAGVPITSPIQKSGAFSEEEPNRSFHQAFFSDSVVSLPAGAWDIVANAHFVVGDACRGETYDMDAAVRIIVGP